MYILKACTGEYEDYHETILGYSENTDDLRKVQKILKRQYADFKEHDYYSEEYTRGKLYEVDVDYTGVWFKVEQIEPIKEI